MPTHKSGDFRALCELRLPRPRSIFYKLDLDNLDFARENKQRPRRKRRKNRIHTKNVDYLTVDIISNVFTKTVNRTSLIIRHRTLFRESGLTRNKFVS